ncbi:aromatic prenyltransferase [Streptomyces sp. NPDC088747]|uniref:aromatic prenyltransferase n=1 Tax=Streptomyces sp. NPDC088747 TaxID=3365886 RepID=UPI00380C93A4
MSGGTEAEELYSAIEESARLVGAACPRDEVWPILAAYEDAITADSGIVFSAQTGESQAGELEYTVQVSGIGDPYARAVANGFVAPTDHPVSTLLSDIQERVSIGLYAIDCGVAGGFKKIYALFPELQTVAQLAAIPSVPPALAQNADFFARHGLDGTAVIGIDYQHRTMNVYFQLPSAGNLDPESVRSILREIGLPEPDEQILEYACTSYRIYTTLSWESPKIQRISFAPQPRPGLDLSALPAKLEPGIEQFMHNAPHRYAGERVRASVVKWSHEEERLDLGSYYQISPKQLKTLTAARD